MDQAIALIGLFLIFGFAFWRKLSMGAVALSFAYFAGVYYYGLTPHQISAGFPGHLVVTLIGVTYLFGIGHVNGTVDQIVHTLVRAVRGKVMWIPWVFFLLAAGITASGALSIATLSILTPIGMAFAQRNKIHPVLMGLSIINGTNAGGFSPIAVYYNIIAGVLVDRGIEVNAVPMFAATFFCSLIVSIGAYFLFGGRALINRTRAGAVIAPSNGEDDEGWTGVQLLTVGTMLAVVTGAIGFGMDVGYVAITGAIFLAAFRPDEAQEGVKQIGWGVVLLIGGMVTYINMLSSAGVIEDLAHAIANIGSPLIAALLLLYITSFVTAFASTNAMFVVIAPLAAPLLLAGQVTTLGFIIALALSTVTTDSCPISTAGALSVANTDEARRDRVFNQLLKWTVTMFAIVPVVTWLLFVVGR